MVKRPSCPEKLRDKKKLYRTEEHGHGVLALAASLFQTQLKHIWNFKKSIKHVV
jgi:hypothetical protein